MQGGGGDSSEPSLPSDAVILMDWDTYSGTGTATYSFTLQDTATYPYVVIQGWRQSNAGASTVGGTFTFN